LDDARVASSLQSILGPQWEIQTLAHNTARSPCELAALMAFTDVLVTPHGFQSMLLLFMPIPSLLFEVFPYRYVKRGYGPFGQEYGVLHSGVVSPPVSSLTGTLLSIVPTRLCMLNKHCRYLARGDDVRLTAHGLNRLKQSIDQFLALLPRNSSVTTADAGATSPSLESSSADVHHSPSPRHPRQYIYRVDSL